MEPTGVLRCKSAVCGLKRPAPNASRRCPVHLNPRSRIALLLLRPLSVGRFASLSAKKYGTHIFQLETELQNISRKCSQSLAELLGLRKAGALWFICVIRRGASALLRHFSSLKAL